MSLLQQELMISESGLTRGSAIAVGMAVFVVMLVLGAFWYMNHKQRQSYTPLSVNDTTESYLGGGFEGGNPQFPTY